MVSDEVMFSLLPYAPLIHPHRAAEQGNLFVLFFSYRPSVVSTNPEDAKVNLDSFLFY